MIEVQYKKLVQRCFHVLSKNLNLLVPGIVSFILKLVVAFILILVMGLFPVFKQIITLYKDTPTLNEFIVSFLQHPTNVLNLITSLVLIFISNFLIGTQFIATKYKMIKEVMINGETSFKKAFFNLERVLYFRVLRMRIYIGILWVIYLIFSFLLFGSVLYIYQNFGKIVGITIGSIFLIILLTLFAFIQLGTLYRYPALLLHKRSASLSLKQSFIFLRSYFNLVLGMAILIILANIAIGLINVPLNILFGLLQEIVRKSTPYWFIIFLVFTAIAFVNLVIDLLKESFIDLLLFFSYKKSKN